MLQALKLTLAPLAWAFLRETTRMPEFPGRYLATEEPLILSCLHRDILPAIMHVRPARPALLVSNSPDGEILIRTLGVRDYGFVRGATGEEGRRAFMELVRELKDGRSVGVAVDGPKGPFGVINEGVFQLARLTGAPILPLLASPGRHRSLGTWDRTVVPVPFSRVDFKYAPLVRLPRRCNQSELAEARRQLVDFWQVQEANP